MRELTAAQATVVAGGDWKEGVGGGALLVFAAEGAKTVGVSATVPVLTTVTTTSVATGATTTAVGAGLGTTVGLGAAAGVGGYLVGSYIEEVTGIGSTIGTGVGTVLGGMGIWW